MQKIKEAPRAYLSHKKERSPLRGALLSFVFSLLVGTVVLSITALILFFNTNALPYLALIGAAEGVLLAFGGGFFAGKLGGRNATLAGMIFGVLYLLFMLLVGYFFPMGGHLLKRVIGCAVFLLLAVLGGTLGGIRPKKRHGSPRHRR